MRKIAAFVSSVAFLIGTLNVPLRAQEMEGSIVGTVQDTSGGAIIGASVVARNEATGVEQKTVSTGAGDYSFPSLRIGPYSVTASYSGFQTEVQHGARVISGQILKLDFNLPVGATTQSLTVSAAQPTIDTVSNVTGTTSVTEQIGALPLAVNGDTRSALGIVMTMSGVNYTPGCALQYQCIGGSIINGAPSGSTATLTDGLPTGVSANEMGEDFFNALPEAISEVRVSSNDTPEFGASSGSTVSMTTRSGTNQLHGDAFDYIHNDDLDARNFFSSTVPINKQNEFGVAIGGPIVIPKIYNGKDRTFFFVYYDGWRYHYSSTTAVETVPTAKMRSGDFSELLGAQVGTDLLGRPIYKGEIYDPSTTRPDGHGGFIRDPFNYGGVLNKINPALLSPVSRAFQSQMSLPNLPGVVNNDVGVVKAVPAVSDRISVKIDHAISTRHRLSFTLEDSWADTVTYPGSTFATTISGIWAAPEPEYHLRLRYNWSISPTALLELAVGFNRDNRTLGLNNFPSQDYGRIAGLKGVLTPDTPVVGIEGYTGFGLGFRTLNLFDQSLPAVVNLMLSKGKHNLKFGGQFFGERTTNIYDIDTAGSFSFATYETALNPTALSTGSGYASFLLGQVDSASLSS